MTSLYIHIPWCRRKCPYCDFNSYAVTRIPVARYVAKLERDLAYDLQYIGKPQLQSIFIGGGTPSLLPTQALDKILTMVANHCSLQENIEITLEANPGTFEEQQCREWLQSGINRLSIGVQSFNNRTLSTLGRIYEAPKVHGAIQAAYAAGFSNINFDLMYGIPNQTVTDALLDVTTALSYAPTHLSWYQLTLEPHTAFFVQRPRLPSNTVIWNMQQQGEELLAQAGFTHYEVAAFTRNLPCRHNLNYWQFGDYLGIGAGAHGKLTLGKQQIRSAKISDPARYLQAANCIAQQEVISLLPFEFMMNALRLYQPITWDLFESRTGCKISSIAKPLQQAEALGLLTLGSDFLITTALGRNFLNNLLELFL